ncbi:MAG: ABC transporter ATP-binding protein [Planctomycetota bacterium]
MIRVDSLHKTFRDVRAVDGVSFEVAARTVCAFLGPNGAGKSTTMRILAGDLAADAGSVEVAGRRVTPDDPGSRAQLGYLPENTPVDRRLSVVDYLDFVGRLRGLDRAGRRAAVERVLGLCSLEDRARQRIGELSKGYRQRVGLAQALLADPPVLVLDEPTSGLDPAEIARIRALVVELGRTKTVLLSTHVLADVQDTATHVVMLRAGRVVAAGSPLDLADEEAPEVLVTLIAPTPDVEQRLLALAGVERVSRRGADARRQSFALEVDDRERVAGLVLDLAREADWRVFELVQRRVGLEDVFLRRMESRA